MNHNPGMMKLFRKSIIFLITTGTLLLLTAIQWQGGLSIAFLSAPSIQNSLPTAQMMRSSAGLMGSGGIYFNQTANPFGDQGINSLNLRYDEKEKDGYRLNLVINNEQVKVLIPDWQLIPIVRFAGSPYFTCLTLSGSLNDTGKAETILKNGGRIINYHQAFNNTLLGWRLLEMDILLIYPEAVNLPEFDDGGSILGSFESLFSATEGTQVFNSMQNFLNGLQKSTGEKHRSWLLNDTRKPVTFRIVNGQLRFDYEMFYNCWRFNCDAEDMNYEKKTRRIDFLRKRLRDEFDIETEKVKTGKLDENLFRTQTIKILLDELKTNFEEHPVFAREYFGETQYRVFENSNREGSLPSLLDKYSTKEITEFCNIAKQINTMFHIVTMDNYSKSLSGKLNEIRKINPLAFEATVNTLKYSAFFRYVKEKFPEEWNKFAGSINNLRPVPAAETPTVIYPGDNSVLTRLLSK